MKIEAIAFVITLLKTRKRIVPCALNTFGKLLMATKFKAFSTSDALHSIFAAKCCNGEHVVQSANSLIKSENFPQNMCKVISILSCRRFYEYKLKSSSFLSLSLPVSSCLTQSLFLSKQIKPYLFTSKHSKNEMKREWLVEGRKGAWDGCVGFQRRSCHAEGSNR